MAEIDSTTAKIFFNNLDVDQLKLITGKDGNNGENATLTNDTFTEFYNNVATDATKDLIRGNPGPKGDRGDPGADGASVSPTSSGILVCNYYPAADGVSAPWHYNSSRLATTTLAEVIKWCGNTPETDSTSHPGNTTTAAVGTPG